MKLALNLRDEMIRNIPDRWKESLGAELHKGYLRMHLKLMQGRVESCDVGGGIEYMVCDQARQEKLIFLPGFADTKENFYNAAQLLARDFDLLVPDLPGFGHSFKHQAESYRLSNYVEWMSAFVEQSGWERFHLAGTSLGGAIAAELALRMPERIKSLCLVDCAAVVLKDRPSIYQEFLDGRNIFSFTSPIQFDYFLNRVCHQPPPIPPFVKEHLLRDFCRQADWYKKVMDDLMDGVRSLDDPNTERMSLNHRLGDIRPPTMIVWGDEDSFFPPATADFIHSRIPGSVLYLLADRGHAPHIEAPFQLAQLIRKFMRYHPG